MNSRYFDNVSKKGQDYHYLDFSSVLNPWIEIPNVASESGAITVQNLSALCTNLAHQSSFRSNRPKIRCIFFQRHSKLIQHSVNNADRNLQHTQTKLAIEKPMGSQKFSLKRSRLNRIIVESWILSCFESFQSGEVCLQSNQ